MKRIGLKAFICLCITTQLFATEKQVLLFCIPGVNGRGSEAEYVRNLIGDASLSCHAVPTPSLFPDLGQARCQSYLHDALQRTSHTDHVIIHATSQGTATALNYLLQVDKGKRIKALILEAPLVTGNSAIIHTIKGPLMNLPGLAALPFSYYWLPYCAKAQFPLYWPSGKQPIKAVNSTSDVSDIPIILIHSQDDPQLSYDDACALYHGLRKKNNNVYLISKEGRKHLNIIKDPHEQEVIRTILQKHHLLENTAKQADLTVYQPDPANFQKLYDELLLKEKKHLYVTCALLTVGAAVVCRQLYAFYKKLCTV